MIGPVPLMGVEAEKYQCTMNKQHGPNESIGPTDTISSLGCSDNAANGKFFNMNGGATKTSAEAIHIGISQDPRLLCVNSLRSDEPLFIPDASLFRWLTQLNLRLAKDSVTRLSKREFMGELNLLREEGSWLSLPREILDFGKRYGFIGVGTTEGGYVFPLAWVLSRASSSVQDDISEVMHGFEDPVSRRAQLSVPMLEQVRDGLGNFPVREAEVIRGRERLGHDGRLTLQQLGDQLHVTRERARGLESQFWRRLFPFVSSATQGQFRGSATTSANLRCPFLSAFLRDFMNSHGSLLVGGTQIEHCLRLFCAKAIGVPVSAVPRTDTKIIGAFPSDLNSLSDVNFPMDYQMGDSSMIHSKLAHTLTISEADVHRLAKEITQAWLRRATKTEKVSLVMRVMGKPSHFSEVSRRFNSIFPEQLSSVHSIHVILARKRFGVTWTGVRGTYALAEWQHLDQGATSRKVRNSPVDR